MAPHIGEFEPFQYCMFGRDIGESVVVSVLNGLAHHVRLRVVDSHNPNHAIQPFLSDCCIDNAFIELLCEERSEAVSIHVRPVVAHAARLRTGEYKIV
ncbi:hypothetical protein [Halocatena marina]|uniref:hypothetical protein n=1 Tax=Halocatena marina TaxID=2934937 RepID=UPI00200D5F11|nr:hypothetical protein [Halocatena marina]